MSAQDYLFSYGTMQLESVQRAIFGRAMQGSADQLPGYRLMMVEIRDPKAVAASGGKRYHPAAVRTGEASDQVAGTLLAVSSEDLANCDAFEVADYRRELVTLASGKQAWLYVDAH